MRKSVAILLTTAALAAAATAANAQSRPTAPVAGNIFDRSNTAHGTPSSYPFVNYTRERELSDQRLRVAAGLVRAGRCDAAARLAQRQSDDVLASKLAQVCAAPSASGTSRQPI